ncbi:MAG: IS1634 family transposase, partial [Gracilibacteraceae bacterium]|nr:IS1634 family transposase [Gracilibacteraceae bacterium]
GITTVAGKYQNDVQFLPEIYNSCVPILPAKNIYTPINRAVAPSSTKGLGEWYANTCLPCLTGIRPTSFTPQNFWNNTSKISEANIEAIEDAILSKMLDVYDIDTSHLIYDATNFFTFIDTMQNCELPKRGHNKEKRNDLRIVAMSLMVSPDFSIPLIHETYPGNMHDTKEFAVMMKRLKTRCQALTGKRTDVTVIFDRGNNSEDNIELLTSGDCPLHYVGGLKKNQASELWAISKTEYTPLSGDSLAGQSAYRMSVDVYGQKVSAVIVYNPELEKGQMQGILLNREKTAGKLLELQEKLMKRARGEIVKGRKPTCDSVTKAVEDILKVEYMKNIFSYEVIESDNKLYLTFGASCEVLERIREETLGKTALFTDRDDFSNEEIICAYRSAWHVEHAFRQMKDSKHLTVRPIFHWTDTQIRIHMFTCVLAYRLCCLLVKELSAKSIRITIDQLINEMSRIKKVTTFLGDIEHPEKIESFIRGSEIAQAIEAAYDLKQKYS